MKEKNMLRKKGAARISVWRPWTSGHSEGSSMISTFLALAYPVALVVKNPPASAGDVRDTGLIPGSGRFPGGGHGKPLQYSCLGNSMDRGSWQATVHRVTKSQTWLKLLSMHTCTRTGITVSGNWHDLSGRGWSRTKKPFYAAFGHTGVFMNHGPQPWWMPETSSNSLCFYHSRILLSLQFNSFVYWLCWVFVAVHGLPLVAKTEGCSLLWYVGFSLRWLLLWSRGSGA